MIYRFTIVTAGLEKTTVFLICKHTEFINLKFAMCILTLKINCHIVQVNIKFMIHVCYILYSKRRNIILIPRYT